MPCGRVTNSGTESLEEGAGKRSSECGVVHRGAGLVWAPGIEKNITATGQVHFHTSPF